MSIVFIRSGVRPEIHVLPESIDTDFYDPVRVKKSSFFPFLFPIEHSSSWTMNMKPYRFLSIFGWGGRKGWEILIEAFVREFSASDPVILYILTSAYGQEGDDYPKRVADYIANLGLDDWRIKNLPLISFLPRYLPHEKLPALYASVDAFVLPSRGEGWGRPLVEAMSMELPVIATYWSGSTEFMTEYNSFPLRVRDLIDIPDIPFGGSLHSFADPDMDHLRYLYRYVFSHPAEAKAKGVQGRRDMIVKFCPACVNHILADHLRRIAKKLFTQNPRLSYHLNTAYEVRDELESRKFENEGR